MISKEGLLLLVVWGYGPPWWGRHGGRSWGSRLYCDHHREAERWTLVPGQLSPFYPGRDPRLSNDADHIQNGSSLLLSKPLWKYPHRHIRAVSWGISEPVTLTVRIHHDRVCGYTHINTFLRPLLSHVPWHFSTSCRQEITKPAN